MLRLPKTQDQLFAKLWPIKKPLGTVEIYRPS